MIEQTLEELEELALLAHAREQQAIIDRWEALSEIRRRKLYHPEFETWQHYLLVRHGMKLSYWDDLQASAKAAKYILEEYGFTLGNKQAARELRSIIHRAVNDDVVPLVLRKAQELAGEFEPIKGKHITAVLATTIEVLSTGGYVSIDGKAIAYDAAITQEETEAIHRQNQYARNGASGNPWSTPFRIEIWDLLQSGMADRLDIPEELDLKTIEIKWRIIEAVTDGQ